MLHELLNLYNTDITEKNMTFYLTDEPQWLNDTEKSVSFLVSACSHHDENMEEHYMDLVDICFSMFFPLACR